MEKKKKFLSEPGFHAYLFSTFILAFCLPFLDCIIESVLINLYGYLFLVWAVIIVLLFFISRVLMDQNDKVR